MENLELETLARLVKSFRNKKVVLTFHSIGDTDSVASATALSSYLNYSTVVNPDIVTRNAERILKLTGNIGEMQSALPQNAEIIIILDANNLSAIGSIGNAVLKSHAHKVFIDHHVYPRQGCPNASIFNDEAYNSTSSIVYELSKLLGLKLKKSTAELLLYGIVSDSADFQNADAKTFMQVSELIGMSGKSYQEIQRNLYEHASPEARTNTINDILNSKVEITHRYILMHGTSSSHANAAAEKAIKIGADAAVFSSITKKEAAISARLRAPLDRECSIHLGRIMQEAAPIIKGTGGGHPCAAGAYGPYKEGIGAAHNAAVSAIKSRLR